MPAAENGRAAEDATKLRVGGEEFSVVDSELLLLELLEKYLHFVDAVPNLAAEALHRVVELIKVALPACPCCKVRPVHTL